MLYTCNSIRSGPTLLNTTIGLKVRSGTASLLASAFFVHFSRDFSILCLCAWRSQCCRSLELCSIDINSHLRHPGADKLFSLHISFGMNAVCDGPLEHACFPKRLDVSCMSTYPIYRYPSCPFSSTMEIYVYVAHCSVASP